MYVSQVAANAVVFDSSTIWLAMICYSLQLYFDFAGYSSMSIGIAKAIGYDLPVNFDFPYISQDISEFWRRWHITLSQWIRDYLYIPFGGNRKGPLRTYINLLLSMALCGLWHGAAWTFVVWGLWHGMALAVNRFWSANRLPVPWATWPLARFCNWLITMLTVVFGWVVFRSQSFGEALFLINRMVIPEHGFVWYQPFCVFALACTILLDIVRSMKITEVYELPLDAWYTPAVLYSLFLLCIIFWPTEFAPFIYVNF